MRRARLAKLPKLSQRDFYTILVEDLGLAPNDTVYIGSSLDDLNLDFPFYQILELLRSAVGGGGNLLFPTYPNRSPLSSYDFLKQGRIFDVRRTPSFTGLLSEFARRQKGSVRSLHPTKSVCAIGPDAAELIAINRDSPYPYDLGTPYRRLVDVRAKVIGLGVWTQYMSFVYTIDDALKDKAPVRTYYPTLFAAECIDHTGAKTTVETYAHDMNMVVHDVPGYMKQHIPPEICQDLSLRGMKFFRADAAQLFEEMMLLAHRGVTVYPERLYTKEFLAASSKN
jgi:hypothetical protein